MLGGQRYLVRYRLIAGESAATGTLITTSAATKILQEERQIRWNLVRRGLTAKYQFHNIIAVSDIMRSKIEIAKKFSLASSNVLITGETGTGKELFAHSIHSASNRSGQPFVAVNCATLPESLLESELFGYEPVPSPAPPKRGGRAFLNRLITVRSSWMRSARFRSPSRQSCCGSCRKRRSAGWAAPR